jgi:hypothetical protein
MRVLSLKKKKEEKKNHRRQTSYHLLSCATSSGRGYNDAFGNMVNMQVWTLYDITCAT